MNNKLLQNEATRTYTLVFESGDSVVDELVAFAAEHDLSASHLTAIGAFSHATLGFYNLEEKRFEEIPVKEQTEVLSLVGNITRYEGAPQLHAHVVLGRRDGSTVGGHLLGATVNPTLEMMVIETPGTLQRRHDDASGLPLIDM
jgi:hypothetical protein